MDNHPLISVIIPTYNEAPTIGVALQSMIDQTYKNLEILVIDDGSTDDTREVVRDFESKDSRVKYLSCPYKDPHRVDFRGVNISVGWLSRNYGMEQARGEWVTFQDADDASLRNRIEVQYKLAKEYGATCVTVSVFPFKEELLGKTLDVEKIFTSEKNLTVRPEEIVAIAAQSKGFLMRPWFPHQYIPFVIKKWFPFARKLFFGNQERYPGADNSMFFHRKVIEEVHFRNFNNRIWPALSGRGVGRDFVFQVAETFKNSYSFKLPLYLWRTKDNYSPLSEFEKYIA